MRSQFYGLEAARSALQAHQAAINVTGHNIANSNTTGYTRQVPDLQQRITSPIGLFVPPHFKSLGSGVGIADIRRSRDRFIDIQIRQEARTGSFWKTIDEGLGQIEVIFSEPNDGGLSKVFDRFWNTWQDLSKYPESEATRALVIETADMLAGAFGHISDQLHLLGDQANEHISIKVREANTHIQQIYALNKQISRLGNVGGNTNDLKDKLDVQIDQLSKLMDFQVRENSNGTSTLVMQGRILASEKTTTFLEVRNNPATRLNEIFIAGTEERFFARYQNGELKAVLDYRDQILPEYIGFMNDMTRGLVENVNLLHRGGYTLDQPPETGLNFFEKIDPSQDFSAGNIKVNEAILLDWKKVAASVSGAPGDGENAIALSRVRERSLGAWNTAEAPEYVTAGQTFQINIGMDGATILIPEFSRVEELVNEINSQLLGTDLAGRVRAYTDGVGLYFSSPTGETVEFADTDGRLTAWNTLVTFGGADTMMINGVFLDFTGVTDIHQLAATINGNPELRGIVQASVDGSRLTLHSLTREPLTVSGVAAEKLRMALHSANPDDAYRGRIAQLGVEKQEANRLFFNQGLLVDQLDIRKETVSGVSLDEEMVNLVKYQHTYESAAMLIRVIDEMLDSIINLIR
ncbi:MAG TPA: flagellar hook-associated protein FlgK [Atribacteraceae bacterium]|nr:flagellar hook-associated protein FlgK [Atribacteraceae bacterium]